MKLLLSVVLSLLFLAGCSTTATRESRSRGYHELLSGRFANVDAYLKASPPAGAGGGTDQTTLRSLASTQSTGSAKDELNRRYELDMSAMLARCEETFQGFESRADAGRRAAFWTAMVGSIAGAVIVPALAASQNASKAAIAGWGGVSGAANVAQSTMRDVGLDAASQVAARATIIQNFNTAVQKAIKATLPKDKEDAIVEGYAACIAYAVTGAKQPTSGGS